MADQQTDLEVSLPVSEVQTTSKRTTGKISTGGAAVGAMAGSVSATKAEKAFLSELVEEYRPELAERLGKDSEAVSKEDFDRAFEEIPALAQAKEAVTRSSAQRLFSSLLSSVTGFFIGLGAANLTRRAQKSPEKQENADNIAAGLSSAIGGFASGKISQRLFNRGGFEKKLEGSAHEKIMKIKDKQLQGEATTPMDVFGVKLALMPEMQNAIEAEIKRPFTELSDQEKAELMQAAFPPQLWLASVEIAENINAGARAQGLLFDDFKRVIEPAATRPQPEQAPQEPQVLPEAIPETVVPPSVLEEVKMPEAEESVEAKKVVESSAPTAPKADEITPMLDQANQQQDENVPVSKHVEAVSDREVDVAELPAPPTSHAERLQEERTATKAHEPQTSI